MGSIGSLVAAQVQIVALLVLLVATGAIIPLPATGKRVRRTVWWLPPCAVAVSGVVAAIVEAASVPRLIGVGSALLAATGLLLTPGRSAPGIRSTRRAGHAAQSQEGRIGVRTVLVVVALGAQFFATYLAWTR